MPSTEHEVPLAMVRSRPTLVPTILRTVFGLDMSGDDDSATITSESFADLRPAELRCDATVLLDDPKKPSHGTIVESQLRYDEEKTFSWPAYTALLRHRHKCPVTLLVFCPTPSVARACAQPIDMGHPEWVLKPLTVHPGMLPAVTDPAEARRLPELAVFTASAYADGPDAHAVLASVAAAIDAPTRDEKTKQAAELYHDYLVSQLSESARKLLEEIVQTAGYEWQSDFAKSHIAKGEAIGEARGEAIGEAKGQAKGEAKMLLLMLEARGLTIPDAVSERVMSCTDTDQLERWGKRAADIDKAEDLLD
ncbi:hypothetical protein ABZ806_00695 [Spirillospora sp. NPDC047418]